jgi:hypothetical protein
MAKIENTTVYPTVLPGASDLLIATDVSDNNKTVTFLVSDIVGGGGVPQDLQSVLTVGGNATLPIVLTGASGNIQCTDIYPGTITAGGSTGSAGQVLSSTGSGIQWVNAGAGSTPSWNDTLTTGNTATQDAIVDSSLFTVKNAGAAIHVDFPAKLLVSGVSDFTGTVNMLSNTLKFDSSATITDGTGSEGVAGQWLISTGAGSGVEWSSTIPSTSNPTLQEVLTAGNSAVSIGMTFTGSSIISLAAGNSITSLGGNTWSGNNNFTANGVTTTTSGINISGSLSDGVNTGSVGQVLTSTVTGVEWLNVGGGTQTLQSVLDIGNSATGANASITISGSLQSGSILDQSGSVGGAGQFLQSNGGTYSWVTGSCCNLQDTLNVGASATSSITLSGVGTSLTVPTVIPALIQDFGGSIGTANQVLTMNSAATGLEWTTNTASGVTSVASSAPGVSTGVVQIISPGIGSVLIQPMAYSGGVNVGHVPVGGAIGTYLQGDGSWDTPSATAGVSSVTNSNSGSTFVDFSVTNVASTGSVDIGNVDLNAAGTANSTTFLRGDNIWAVPAGGGGSTVSTFSDTYKYSAVKYTPLGKGSFNATPGAATLNLSLSQSLSTNDIQFETFAPPAWGSWNSDQLHGAMFYSLPKQGGCKSFQVQRLCSMSTVISTNVPDIIRTTIYLYAPCNQAFPVQIVAICDLEFPGPFPDKNAQTLCCDFTIDPSWDGIIADGQALMMTQQYDLPNKRTILGSISYTIEMEDKAPK